MHRVLRALLPLSLPLVLPACGRGGGTAEASPAQDSAAMAEDPRYIYGATASDNVRLIPVELDIRDLPGGWSGTRVAAISDLQLGLWPDNEKVALAAIRKAIEARPDFFVLLGDYVGPGADLNALDRVLEPLRGKVVFAVLGDRDEVEDTDGAPDSLRILTTQVLERNGVTVLRNARARYIRNGDTAYVAGLEPYFPRRPDWYRSQVLAEIPGGEETPLVLSHMPVTAVLLPTDRYTALVAGHTFCGGVEVPGTPRLAWFNTEVVPGTPSPTRTRIYRLRGTTTFITCGVGYSFVPIRFGSAPEVALVTLRGFGTPESSDSTLTRTMSTDSLLDVYRTQDSLSRNARTDTAAGDSAR